MIYTLDTNIYLDSVFDKQALSAVKKSLSNHNFIISHKQNNEIRTYILKLSCQFYFLRDFSDTLDIDKLKESKPMKEIRKIREKVYKLFIAKDKKGIKDFCEKILLYFMALLRGLPKIYPENKEKEAKILGKEDIKQKKNMLNRIKKEDVVILLIVYDYAVFEKHDHLTFVTRDFTDIYNNKQLIQKELEIITILNIKEFTMLDSV